MRVRNCAVNTEYLNRARLSNQYWFLPAANKLFKFCCLSMFVIVLCLIGDNIISFVSIVDIGAHLFIVSLVTKGFQCDVDKESLNLIDVPWLEPFLLIINVGTHGLYPFPFIMRIYKSDFMIPATPRCYPGMVHINRIDVLNFLINFIWLKFVTSYVASVHKKDPERMRTFFGLSLVKLIFEILYLAYQPDLYSIFTTESYWFLKFMDICIGALFLIVINKYIAQLRIENAQRTKDQPPSYIECLINGPITRVDEKRDLTLTIEEKKNDESVPKGDSS
ncbi:unnamed protein product [Danaus chrysippus]|uniref:(African queen) hypothetical protein n=1 Tax=Danaus chrysippus TaxID=151541 RepID=A0A8J2QQ88_9NEOP|nr:unnamed protein product [Danaus chrysippus]